MIGNSKGGGGGGHDESKRVEGRDARGKIGSINLIEVSNSSIGNNNRS